MLGAKAIAVITEHAGQASRRFVDLAISLRVADHETLADGSHRLNPATDEEIIAVGGRWDTKRRAFVGDATTVRVIRLHRGQERAGRWLAEWIRRRTTGDWEGFRKVYSILLMGGRRSGKSHLACVALVLYLIAFPRTHGRASLVWAISPAQTETDELEQALRALMPRAWYVARGGGNGKPATFRMVSRARLILLSGHKPRALKRGRVDVAVFNEGQSMGKRAYVQLRGAIADSGGLVIVAANPPDEPVGLWLADHYEAAKAGTIDAELFELAPQHNPLIDVGALTSMAREVDENVYAREVLGELRAIGALVFHGYSPRESRLDPPARLIDITADVTRRHFGRPAGYILGVDLQRTPAMVATVAKVFRDPEGPADEEILWIVDEVVVEDADEDELLDALESLGRWTPAGRLADDCYRGWKENGDDPATPAHCVVVMDASAWWQDGAHSKGQASDRRLAARRWAFCYKPQRDSDRNPDIGERVKVTNARLKNAEGRRRLFVATHCKRTAEALAKWENRDGRPARRSQFAHLCDAVSYTAYRLYGLPRVKRSVEDPHPYVGVRRFERDKTFERDKMFGVPSGRGRALP